MPFFKNIMQSTEKKIFTVSEINKYVKNTIEHTFEEYSMVEGEISQLQTSQLGHVYITLKDEKSSVRCTLWSSRVKKLQTSPKVGLKAIIKCKVTLYEKTGSYQLDIIDISSFGVGKFHELFEKLKLKLKNEGLFDIKFKKELPIYPKSISVITSLSGSVLQDILKIFQRRLPVINIDIYGCNVQGNNCSSSIIKQLITINKKNTADIIIIARGGGTLEDLIEYNDEFLARQIYNSKIPIITAIGHETDTTIADLVSDFRAATPSEAAEIATSISADDIKNYCNEFINDLDSIMYNFLNNLKNSLKEHKNNIDKKNPITRINSYSQTIDIFYETLKSKLFSNLIYERDKINSIKIELKNLSPINKITIAESRLKENNTNLKNILKNFIEKQRNNINLNRNTLNDISPLNILNKGYSVVYNNKRVVNKVSNCELDDNLKIKMVDGEIYSTVKKIKRNN